MTDDTTHHGAARSGGDTLLERYLVEAMERVEAGQPLDLTAICQQHPYLEQPLREALSIADVIPDLQHGARARDPLAGEVLADRYRLEERVGAGAMGAVYRATDQVLDREVAVKILQAGLFRRGGLEQRFSREAEVLATLDHPAVVTIYDRGVAADGVPFLVMRLLRGCSLAGVVAEAEACGPERAFGEILWLKRVLGRAEAPERSFLRLAIGWAAELAAGLQSAHEAGVFHRDVKPSNIFVTRDYEAVLLDFGIASWAQGDASLTATGTTLGTPWYMPPEQAAGKVEPSAAQDIYSLGATLYHLLAGRPPYDGDPSRVLVQLQTEDPVALAKRQKGLPRDVVAIVERCMERDPRRRYSTMAALAADLRAFLAHRPVVARPLSPARRWARKVRRAPAPLLATAVVVLLGVVALFAAFWWQGKQEARHAELVAQLPAQLAIEWRPEERLATDMAYFGSALPALDEILSIEPGDLPSRLLRGAVRLDLGQHDAAAADFRELADRADSPYLSDLAARYTAADPETRGCEAVDLSGLPAPSTAAEKYVAAFHLLRQRDPRSAREVLGLLTEALSGYAAARDLRLLALLECWANAPDATTAQKQAWLQQARDEALRLEGVYGRPTARTLHVRSICAWAAGELEDAAALAEQCLALRPGRHGPTQNLGVVQYNLGRYDAAERHFRAALAIRPGSINTLYMLARTQRQRGDFAEALATLDQMAPDTTPWQAYDERGATYRDMLVAAVLAEQTQRCADLAEKAVAAFEQAARLQQSPGRAPVYERQISFCRAMAMGERSAALDAHLAGARALASPTDFDILLWLMGDDGFGARTARLRTILERTRDLR